MKKSFCLGLCLFAHALSANAQEIVVYNDIAFIKNSLEYSLDKGINQIQFEGVPTQIRQESILINGNGINVLEQNYDYDLLSYSNILEKEVGKTVKTVMQNPKTGENIFDKAVLVNANYGSPILKFDYGYETNFPGRIVFDKLPEGLSVKPSLEAKLEVANAGKQNVDIAYISNGFGWNSNYVLEVLNNQKMNVNAWVNVRNESGADLLGYKLSVVAGSVNTGAQPPMPRPMMLAKSANFAAIDMVSGVAPQGINQNNFYKYDVSSQVDLMNNQTKQLKLFAAKDVAYNINYNIESPMYIGRNSLGNSFDKINPEIEYEIENSKDNNLGLVMPSGVMRVYNYDAFLGQSDVAGFANEEVVKFVVGKSFDLYAKGSVKEVKPISKDVYEANVEVNFYNAKAEEQEINFTQSFAGSWQILAESTASKKENANKAKWKIKVLPNSNTTLIFTVRISN